MLSKYYHLEEKNRNGVKVDMNGFISALIGNLKERYKEVKMERISPGGTLGIFFELQIDGQKKFVKTHPYGKCYRDNLLKEMEIITLLYRDIVSVERVDICLEQTEITFLIMDYLHPVSNQADISDIKTCIKKYQQKLSVNDIAVQYSFQDIIRAGVQSLEILRSEGFLTESYMKCRESIERVSAKQKVLPEVIGHGDLSNVNIMCKNSKQLIVIDWEDALVTFPEYDFLYWLTFFLQRKYYSGYLFQENGIDKIWGTDIMVLITLIKSEISYCNGSYKTNSISFEERVNEIYDMIK